MIYTTVYVADGDNDGSVWVTGSIGGVAVAFVMMMMMVAEWILLVMSLAFDGDVIRGGGEGVTGL